MKRLSLALGAVALAVACAQSAKADTFSFSFTGFDFGGSGTFTATETGKIGNSSVYDVTGVSGSVSQLFWGLPVSTSNIVSLLPAGSFDGNDNELFDPGLLFGLYNFDQGGVSFLLANGFQVNLGDSGFLTVADEKKGKDDDAELASFEIKKISSTSPVPEPGTLALLGTGILGAAGAIRRRVMA
jgi:PEP-CTERM motif